MFFPPFLTGTTGATRRGGKTGHSQLRTVNKTVAFLNRFFSAFCRFSGRESNSVCLFVCLLVCLFVRVNITCPLFYVSFNLGHYMYRGHYLSCFV